VVDDGEPTIVTAGKKCVTLRLTVNFAYVLLVGAERSQRPQG